MSEKAKEIAHLEERLVIARTNRDDAVSEHMKVLGFLNRDYSEHFEEPITFERLWFIEERRRWRVEEEHTVAELEKDLARLTPTITPQETPT